MTNLKDPVKLPSPNWDLILKRCAILMVIVTGVALFTRFRSLIIVAQVVDVAIILSLLVIVVVSLINRSK